jgi:GDP-L-fucose synthase
MKKNVYMEKDSKIFVAGHKGMVGSAIYRELVSQGYGNIVTADKKDLDLTIQSDVNLFFEREKPEYVFLAAAKVGGIKANSNFKGDFIYRNLMIQTNVIESSRKHSIKKLVFLGSSCIYPKACEQPIKEEYLLNGYLEPTNDAYAIAKISGIKMCQSYNQQFGTNFISLMPTNLYGPNDNYNLESSHVVPAMIRKFHEAKASGQERVEIWGSGSPMREFLYVDDLAEACVFLMNNYSDGEIVNVGSGEDLTIKELAYMVKEVVGFDGDIFFNTEMPDGTPRKLLDISKIKSLGWYPKTNLKEGLSFSYQDFLSSLT